MQPERNPSVTNTAKELWTRTVTTIATKPNMTPMNPLVFVTVTTLAKTAATTTHPYP